MYFIEDIFDVLWRSDETAVFFSVDMKWELVKKETAQEGVRDTLHVVLKAVK